MSPPGIGETTVWQSISQLFPPFFLSTILAALFGTFAGAFVTSRVQGRKAVVTELNSINVALALAFMICNKVIAIKSQHVKSMKERYDSARERFVELDEAVAAGRGPVVFEFVADFQTLSPLKLPIHLFEKEVFDKISIRGRGLAAAVEVTTSLDALNSAIEYRNLLIAEVQKARPTDQKKLAQMYFGTRAEGGVIDEKFRTVVEAIALYTDDCIFFSKVFADDVKQYAVKLRSYHKRRLRLFLPKPSSADWSSAEKADLIPNASLYSGWTKGFQEVRPWYRRIAKHVGSNRQT